MPSAPGCRWTRASTSRPSPMLTPGRYVGAAYVEDDGEPFEEKMARRIAMLRDQTKEPHQLDDAIRKNLKELEYGG